MSNARMMQNKGKSADGISLMYGRFRVLSGDISLMYGSPKGEKPEKCTPEVGFSHDGLPYISEKAHDKAPILPYIRQI